MTDNNVMVNGLLSIEKLKNSMPHHQQNKKFYAYISVRYDDAVDAAVVITNDSLL